MIRLLALALFLPHSSRCKLITVETSRGKVQGFDHDFGNDKSQRFFGYGQMFLGIPFVKAPVGERRFTLPEDICQYNERGEVYNATYYRPRCWQNLDSMNPPKEMSEDCLHLNVITPNISGSCPVMVYVHGGMFTGGGADKLHWKGVIRNLVSRGVVVVTFQYRIGLIGFFTTYTEKFPPNRGMYDQIMALRWVNEEIANFGGDSTRITLFGQSAGAASVSDLSLSPLARGLFHQLIQTSGSALQEIESIDDPRGKIHHDRARQICQIEPTDWGTEEKDQALMDCLLKASPHDLIEYDGSDVKSWNVAIDGAFLPDYPENLAKSRPKYPALIGDMLEESAFAIPGIAVGDLSKVSKQTMRTLMHTSFFYMDEESATNLSDMIIYLYADGEVPADDDHLGWAQLMAQIYTGFIFSSNMIRDVQWHWQAGNEDVWLFTLTHRSLLPFETAVEGWIPITHSCDLPYLWFYPKSWESYRATESDLDVAEHFGKLWTDFATNGKLPMARAGEEMNYIEIGDRVTSKTNWRPKADYVYNKLIPNYTGNFPPIKLSDESWTKMIKLGERILPKWNSKKMCCYSKKPESCNDHNRRNNAIYHL